MRRRLLAGLAPLAAVLVIIFLAVALFTNHPRPIGGSGDSTPVPVTSPYSSLADISMISPTEGWAAGYSGTCTSDSTGGSCTATDPLLMHYRNGQWSAVPLPFKGILTAISMLSATDGWASGSHNILHYDGHTWKQMPNPEQLSLFKIQMLSDKDGWAIGISGSTQALLHYDGKTWKVSPLPANLLTQQQYIGFNDLTMISPTEGWVTGAISAHNGSEATGFILHYANGQWTMQSSIDNVELLSISMSSATDGWAVGDLETDTPMVVNGTPQTLGGQPVYVVHQHPIMLHYVDGAWTQITSTIDHKDGAAWQVSMISDTDGWAVGPEPNTLLHYNGQQWTTVPLAISNNSTIFISRLLMLSATEGWAVGYANVTILKPGSDAPPAMTQTALILHFQHGKWSVVHS